jgi:hypothetical protein
MVEDRSGWKLNLARIRKYKNEIVEHLRAAVPPCLTIFKTASSQVHYLTSFSC